MIVGPYRRVFSMCRARIAGCLLGSPALLARDDVGGVPLGPVVLRSGRLGTRRGAPLSLAAARSASRRPGAESPSGKPRLNLLEQPAVAVRIAERGEREIGATFWVGPGSRPFVPATRRRRLEVEHLAHLDAARDELGACRLDVVDDEERPWTEPGAAFVKPLPKKTEHGEPGGVSCTTRQSSAVAKSASSRHPRPW